MKISLIVPFVNRAPTHPPRSCAYCEGPIFLLRHGTVSKPVEDHKVGRVEAHRYKYLSCKGLFGTLRRE